MSFHSSSKPLRQGPLRRSCRLALAACLFTLAAGAAQAWQIPQRVQPALPNLPTEPGPLHAAPHAGPLKAVSPQTITFPAQADQILSGPGASFAIDPLATANSGLPVNYLSHAPAVCTVSGTTVTMVDAGTCMLEAWLPPVPGQWLAASGIFVSIQIRRTQLISFPPQDGQPFVAGDRFELQPPATASSGLPVGYDSATPGICTVSGTTVTMVSEGVCTVTARQPGNALWTAADDVSQDIALTVVAPPAPDPGPAPDPDPDPGPGVAPPDPPPAALPAPVPALGFWPLALLAALAAGLGTHALRQGRQR